MPRLFVFLLMLLGLLPVRAAAEVSLVVCGPGSDIYELEGHAALRVRTEAGADVAVNWGLFDFNAPGFVWRFALGHTDYMCGATPWPYFLEAYRRDGRSVEEYRLHLTPGQEQRLIGLLQTNLLPANATYRYNYVKDNCSTRPLRVIEAAIGDTLALPDPLPGCDTFRDIMRHYHNRHPWYQFGIDLALGPGIDYPLSAREKAFVPLLLGGQLAATGIVSEAIADAPQTAQAPASTPWYATPMAAAIAILLICIAFTVRDQRRHRVTRWLDSALYSLFGLAGCLIFFLTFFSTHEATAPNHLIVWLNPLCFIPVVFIWIKKAQSLVMCYQIANFAALLALCICWPYQAQCANAAFWPLIAADAIRAANYVLINKK